MPIQLIPYTRDMGSVDHLIQNAEALARKLDLDYASTVIEFRVLLVEERFLLGYSYNCYDAQTLEIVPPESPECTIEASMKGWR